AAADVLDVDYSTKESTMAAARSHADEQTATMRGTPASSPAANAIAERVFTLMSKFVTGRGIIVKPRKGVTPFGEGLTDEEIRYLHAVVRRALAGNSA